MARGEVEAASRPLEPDDRAGGGIGRFIVLGVLLVSLLAALLILHDAQSTGADMSVPPTVAMPRPTTAATARHDVLAFVPSSAPLTVLQAIREATGASGATPAAHVTRLAGGGWSVVLRVPADEAALLKSGHIFTGVGQGASNLKSGLLQVTDGSVQYVVHVDAASGQATFDFRLSAGGQTLSSTNWNANTVLSQTEVGDEDIP